MARFVLLPLRMRHPRYNAHLKALHLQSLGVRLLTVCYCCIGALLGQCIRAGLLGRLGDWTQDSADLAAFAVLGNFLGFSALVLFFRRRSAEPPLDSPVYPIEVLLRGLPAGNRVAFALFALAWLVGTILGISLPVS